MTKIILLYFLFKRSILIAHLNKLLFRKGRHYLLCLLYCIMLCEDYCLPSQCRSSFIYIEPFCSSRSLYKNTFHRYNEKEAGDFRFYGTYGTLVWAKAWTTHTQRKHLSLMINAIFIQLTMWKREKKLYKTDICNIKHICFSTLTTRSTVQHGSS